MAKVEKAFHAQLDLNKEKGGGWLATVVVKDGSSVDYQESSAWKNASAAKRWIKDKVKAATPRKSVPLTGTDPNEKGKFQSFSGSITYKITV